MIWMGRIIQQHHLSLAVALCAMLFFPLSLFATCTIDMTPLSFGTVVLPAVGPTTAEATITLNCDVGDMPYELSIDGGTYYQNTTRNLSGGGANMMPYQLFQDAGHSILWGNGTAELGAVKNPGVVQIHTIFGSTEPSGQTGEGSYSDQSVVTISW